MAGADQEGGAWPLLRDLNPKPYTLNPQFSTLKQELEVIKREASGRFSGIYALPSFHSVWDWHGVIFIRSGLYQDGVFKFTIRLPVKYPLEAPKVTNP